MDFHLGGRCQVCVCVLVGMELRTWCVRGGRRDEFGKTREQQINKDKVVGCMRSVRDRIEHKDDAAVWKAKRMMQ